MEWKKEKTEDEKDKNGGYEDYEGKLCMLSNQ